MIHDTTQNHVQQQKTSCPTRKYSIMEEKLYGQVCLDWSQRGRNFQN